MFRLILFENKNYIEHDCKRQEFVAAMQKMNAWAKLLRRQLN